MCFTSQNTGSFETGSLYESLCKSHTLLLENQCAQKIKNTVTTSNIDTYDELKALVQSVKECINSQLVSIENNEIHIYNFQPHRQTIEVEAENGLSGFPYNYKVTFGPSEKDKGVLSITSDNTYSPLNFTFHNGTGPVNMFVPVSYTHLTLPTKRIV